MSDKIYLNKEGYDNYLKELELIIMTFQCLKFQLRVVLYLILI